MRRTKLLHGLCAAGLAITIGVAGPVQAAQAAQTKARAEAATVAFDWASLTIAVASALLSGGGSSDAALQAAVRQIEAAIEQAKNDIIGHTDAIAAAEVQACVRAATIEFSNINVLPPPVLILWAQSATSCATKATAYLNTLVSPQAVNNLGYLIGPIFSIVLAARAKAKLTEAVDLILQDQVRSYQAVKTKLAPQCAETQTYDWELYVAVRYYTCTAYTGATTHDFENWIGDCFVIPPDSTTWCRRENEPIDRAAVELAVTRDTSRPIAIEALARLSNPRPVM